MNLKRFLFAGLILLAGVLPSIGAVDLAALKDIHRFALSVALTEFPITQKQLFDYVGLPAGARPSWGSRDKKGPYEVYWLADAAETEWTYYGARIHYGENRTNPDDIPVLSVEIVFVSRVGLTFVAENGESLEHMLPNLKRLLKKSGLSPKDFATRFCQDWQLREEMEANQPAALAARLERYA